MKDWIIYTVICTILCIVYEVSLFIEAYNKAGIHGLIIQSMIAITSFSIALLILWLTRKFGDWYNEKYN